MGITVEWQDASQHVLLWRFEPDWTWDDLYAQAPVGSQMAASVNHTVHVIVDMSQLDTLPSNPLQHAQHLKQFWQPNVGLTVVVVNGTFVQIVLNLFRRLTRTEIIFTNSRQEAQALIYQYN